jgi:hypothetical protein
MSRGRIFEKNMSNLINVTACDNELIIVAYPISALCSYELCRIVSGYNNKVNVAITLNNDSNCPFLGTTLVNGLWGGVDQSINIGLPVGQYSLLLIGINWGDQTQFDVTVNGNSYTYNPSTAVGVVWTPTPIAFTVN